MIASPEVASQEEYDDDLLTLRLKNGNAVHLVARGHMFNLAGPRPIGNSIEAMDLGFALQARCLEAVARGTVPATIDAAVARPTWRRATSKRVKRCFQRTAAGTLNENISLVGGWTK